jgi:hypothetical protein
VARRAGRYSRRSSETGPKRVSHATGEIVSTRLRAAARVSGIAFPASPDWGLAGGGLAMAVFSSGLVETRRGLGLSPGAGPAVTDAIGGTGGLRRRSAARRVQARAGTKACAGRWSSASVAEFFVVDSKPPIVALRSEARPRSLEQID